MPELTPVEIVGYEVCEAGSPLALDNGQFTKIDNTMSDMSKDQLQIYVHEIARTLPEDRRPYFLETMEAVKNGKTFSAKKHKKHDNNLHAEMKAIKDILTNINAGERCLDSEYNEEWDDWYNSDVEEFFFSDQEEVLQDIEKGIHLLHKCVDTESYKEGRELAELLSAIEVSVTGDYEDYNGMSIRNYINSF